MENMTLERDQVYTLDILRWMSGDSPDDGVAKDLDFVREPSADPSPYHKRKPLQDWEKIVMKHSRSGTTASKSIQIKCLSDDEEENENSTNSSTNTTSIKYTSTGILSNRRPIDGITPTTTSGTSTPENAAAAAPSHRLGLLAAAKRDAAKRGLYSKFFRGPVLGPDTMIEDEKRLSALLVSQAFFANDSIAETVSLQETIEIQPTNKSVRVDLEVSESLENHAKRRKTGPKTTRQKETVTDGEKERKRRKQQHRKEKEKHRDKTEDTEANSCTLGESSPLPISQKDQKVEDVRVMEKNKFSGNAIDGHESQADRKRRKEEKKRLKKFEKDADRTHSNSGNQTKPGEIGSAAAPELLDEPKKRKKKRKHADAE